MTTQPTSSFEIWMAIPWILTGAFGVATFVLTILSLKLSRTNTNLAIANFQLNTEKAKHEERMRIPGLKVELEYVVKWDIRTLYVTVTADGATVYNPRVVLVREGHDEGFDALYDFQIYANQEVPEQLPFGKSFKVLLSNIHPQRANGLSKFDPKVFALHVYSGPRSIFKQQDDELADLIGKLSRIDPSLTPNPDREHDSEVLGKYFFPVPRQRGNGTKSRYEPFEGRTL